jgi:hypothetical protein
VRKGKAQMLGSKRALSKYSINYDSKEDLLFLIFIYFSIIDGNLAQN